MKTLKDKMNDARAKRRERMEVMRAKGWSDVRIAAKVGLTRQMVHLILGKRK